MNFLFKILLGLAGLIVVFLCAALIAPYFINWDDYSDKFEQQASEIIGQKVKVGGDSQVRLLPLPWISFSNLEVGEELNGAPLMQVERFSLKVELFPFLSGDVQIVEMTLDHPRLNLVMGENGRINWGEGSASSTFSPEHVKLEKLAIKQGEINISGLGGGRSINAASINGDLSAESLLGPWKMDFTSDVNEVRSAFKISTGSYQESGKVRLKVDAKREDRPYRLLLDGPLKFEDDKTSWDGKFILNAFSKEQVDEMTIRHEPLPIKLEGAFSANPQKIALHDYRLEVGEGDIPYYVTGSAQLDLKDEPYFGVQADGAQIDLQNLDQDGTTDGEKAKLHDGVNGLIAILKKIPKPSTKGIVDIHLPALVSKDSFIREIKATISPNQDGWLISRSSAELPGNTTLKTSGLLNFKDELTFKGDILLASRQPSGFASWVSGEVDPEIRKLRSFGLDSSITVNSNSFLLDGMELRLDDALIKGRFEQKHPENQNPELHLALNGDHMDGRRLEALYVLILGSRDDLFQDHDMDVDLKADVFVADAGHRKINVEGLDAHVKLREGSINLERLNVTSVLGAKITSSGSMENILEQPSGNSKFTLTASDGRQLSQFLQEMSGKKAFFERFRDHPQLTQNTQLSVELSSKSLETGTQGQILATGSMGGTEFNFNLGFDGLLEGMEFDAMPLNISIQTNSDTPSILFRQLGFDMLPVEFFGELEGPMKLSIDMQGDTAQLLETRISAALPQSNLSMVGTVAELGKSEFNTNFQVKMGSENVDAYMKNFGVNIPGIVYGENVPVSLSANFTTSADGVKFEDLSGQVSGNGFDGGISIVENSDGQTYVEGALNFDQINPSLFLETVYGAGQDTLASSEDNTFKSPYYTGLDGYVTLSGKQLIFDEEVVGSDPKFVVELDDGNLELEAQEIELLDGKFSGEMEMRNVDGLILSNMTYRLEHANLSKLVDTTQFPDIWKGQVVVNGSLETNGSNVQELIKNLAGAGHLKLNEGQLEGYNPDGFRQILKSAEAEGFEPGVDVVRHLVDKHILVSSLKIPDVESDFIISRGHLKVNKVITKIAETEVIGELDLDLDAGTVKAQLHSSFDQEKKHAVSGAQPQVSLNWEGTSKALTRKLDSTRLESYLALKAIELGQRKIFIREAKALEKQRLNEQLSALQAQEDFLERKEEERLEKIRLEEEERLEKIRLEEEARKIAEEEAARAAQLAAEDAYNDIDEEATEVEPLNVLRDELGQNQNESNAGIDGGDGNLDGVNRVERELVPQ